MRELTKKAANARTILILVGRGKSTLTNWIIGWDPKRVFFGSYKNEDKIKQAAANGSAILHLQSEEEYKKLGTGIKRRAIMFKIDF